MDGKLFGLLLVFTVSVSNGFAAEYCYNDVVSGCNSVGGEIQNCNAKYGHANSVITELQNYANLHIARNFQFILMATHFNNYQKNREGFYNLYKKYADKSWEDAIDLIKYIAKRGGNMDFKYKKEAPHELQIENYELFEIQSVGKALDMWKNVAEEAHHIHGEISRRRNELHDPEVASYIENKFVHEHSEIIRELAGHSNDLKRLLSDKTDSSLALFLFDNYLKKITS